MSLVTEPLPAYVEHFLGTKEIILSILFVHQQHAHLLHQVGVEIFSDRFFFVMKRVKNGRDPIAFTISIAYVSFVGVDVVSP